MMALLVAKKIRLGRQLKVLPGEINFTLCLGQLISVMGQNGCGKSTLLHTVAGLHQPSGGQIIYTPGHSMAYVGHVAGLHPHLTVQDNWLHYARLVGGCRLDDKKIQGYIQAFGLESVQHQYPHNLSAGQLQKSKLIKLLIGAQMIWLLDEPSSHLDQAAKKIFYRMLQTALNEGVGVLMTHHEVVPKYIPVKQTIRLNIDA